MCFLCIYVFLFTDIVEADASSETGPITSGTAGRNDEPSRSSCQTKPVQSDSWPNQTSQARLVLEIVGQIKPVQMDGWANLTSSARIVLGQTKPAPVMNLAKSNHNH